MKLNRSTVSLAGSILLRSSRCPQYSAYTCSPCMPNLPVHALSLPLTSVRYATHGAQGRANGPKNGPGKRLGAKKTGDEYVIPGNIIFRQRGTNWHAGENVGMGRDHTLFARQPGYVRYYRDPARHPKRHYIGVVLEKHHTLPVPPGAPRRRRLGMQAVSRPSEPVLPGPRVGEIGEESLGGEVGLLGDSGSGEVVVAEAAREKPLSKAEAREMDRRKKSGRIDVGQLQMRPNYSYRESNAEIGRAAERAGVQVKLFKRGDRFLAWRKRAARVKANAEKRAIGRNKAGKSKKK